jgi:hypothetical protein
MTVAKCVGLLVVLLLAPAVTRGFAPIQGAFGVDLGAIAGEGASRYQTENAPSGGIQAFVPADPRPGLDEYFLQASPITGQIYAISGRGEIPSLSRCLKERIRIAKELKRVHGAPELVENSITSVFGGDPSLVGRQGTRTIRVECDVGQEGSQVTIEYRDEGLEEIARREQETLKKEKQRTAFSK